MSPSMIKEVKGTDFPACSLLGLFHRLRRFPLEDEIQIVQEALSAVYILHLLKESLYLHKFIFRTINAHTMAAEIAPLDTGSM